MGSPLRTLPWLFLAACGAAREAPPTPATPNVERVSEQIIGTRAAGTAPELIARGDEALRASRFADAHASYATVLEAWRSGSLEAREHEPQVRLGLAVAQEGLGQRAEAIQTYLELERSFGAVAAARQATARLFSLLAYSEDWKGLGAVADRVLATETGASDFERMAALAARALARVEQGDDGPAGRDVQQGLDLMESLRVGGAGRLPSSAAMLRLAQAEVRRVRSERIELVAGDGARTSSRDLRDFLPKMEARCEGLMEAQRSYADAMRATDPFFIAFGGYRVGEMYRSLHRAIAKIPPPAKAKSEEDEQLFFAIMHVRYRVLLEKAHDMMDRTLAMVTPAAAAATTTTTATGPNFASWLERARGLKGEIEAALAEERAFLAALPYDEPTVRRALELMREKAERAAEQKASRR